MRVRFTKNRASGISIASRHIIIALAVMLILPMLISCGGGGGGGGGGGSPNVITMPPGAVTISFEFNNYRAVQNGAVAELELEITNSDGDSMPAPKNYTFNLTATGADVADYEIYDGGIQIAGGTDSTPEIAFMKDDTSKTLRIVAVGTSTDTLTLRFPVSTDPEYLHSTGQTDVYLLTSSPIVTFTTDRIDATEGGADVMATLNLNPMQIVDTDIIISSFADFNGDIELRNAGNTAKLPSDPDNISDVTLKILTVPARATSVNFIIKFVADSTYETTETHSLTIPDILNPSFITVGTENAIALMITDDGSPSLPPPACAVTDILSYNGTRSCSRMHNSTIFIFSVNRAGYLELDGSIKSRGTSFISISLDLNSDEFWWVSSPADTTNINDSRSWTLDSIIS